MLKTYLYLPDEINENIIKVAKRKNKSKAEIVRLALKEGLAVIDDRRKSSASAFLRIAKIAQKNKAKGPKNLAADHNKYLWEEYKK